jgi:outer membrane receptor for ferrienterochelin and colicin
MREFHEAYDMEKTAAGMVRWFVLCSPAVDDGSRHGSRKSSGGGGGNHRVITRDVVVEADKAKEEAKMESQQTMIITAADIAKKQAKSVEDIIFSETGVSRTVDAMGRVTVSIRGAEPRHTLILIDGQPVMGDFAKYSGAGDELQRLGTENVDHIEIIQGAASAKYGSDSIGGVINVITKKAAKTAGLQVNVEGRRAKQDGDIFPYQNFFLRADSGQIGKFRAAVYGSKREIMPVYSVKEYGDSLNGGQVRNSLRYYGDIKNIGMSGSYEINDRNKIDFNMDKTKEDMERNIKHSDAAPQTHFKRDLDRSTYRMTYTGNNGGSTDWKFDVDYAKMNEDDITLTTLYANSKYQGKNTLDYVDNIMHKQYNIKASANTQINDSHLLTYGFGYTKETGEGSRIKNAPDTKSRYIDPWAYDKNLKENWLVQDGANPVDMGPSSNVHDYAMAFNDKGIPYYDQDYEYYGAKNGQGKPAFTYDDYIKYGAYAYGASSDVIARRDEFAAQLKAQNPNLSFTAAGVLIDTYYNDFWKKQAEQTGLSYVSRFNGKEFKEEYNLRQNRQTIGRVTLKKQNFYVQDTWQLNPNTILSPIVRIDHSDLFGTNATFNMGLTHNLGGRVNRRFKANIGTGYTEPGMGELYYNWEMYAGTPAGHVPGLGDEIGRLGYYWVGNPYLKPEKSVNFDVGIEGETGKTSARLNVFHNRIKDYMSTYFTGEIMDFHPGASIVKFLAPPDMIYSFKNIGKAEITGVEAQIEQKFDDHWSGKLGYTYLHAINKSDPDMPEQLLDKPQHKIDIGITYENKGWRASLWGDYYIHMLDSNSITNNGNYMESGDKEVHYFYKDKSDWSYQKKTFGLWNLLIQKELSKDSTVYVGIDNLFNHRDDDQAFMERVYKFGVNLKFGADGQDNGPAAKTVGKAKKSIRAKLRDTDWFIKAPFDTEKQEGVEFIGDYRARWNSFTGKIKPSEMRVTPTASVGTAYKNVLEKSEHGFEQRLHTGIEARIGDNTNVILLGSASGMSGVDTKHDVSDSKGLNHQRVDTIDVTQHAEKWDFSIGRLTEPMGTTGYWFGKEYDGGRAVWTSGKNQVRLGYGDFGSSTGINDSAYTHATRQLFMRAPTKYEWLGYDSSKNYPYDGVFSDMVVSKPGFDGLYQKLAEASTPEEQKKILNQYLEIIKKDAPDTYNTIINETQRFSINTFAWKKITVTDMQGNPVGTYLAMASSQSNQSDKISFADFFDKEKLQNEAGKIWDKLSGSLEKNADYTWKVSNNESFLLSPGQYHFKEEFLGYGEYKGSQILQPLITQRGMVISTDKINQDEFNWFGTGEDARQEARDKASQSLWNKDYSLKGYHSWKRLTEEFAVGMDGHTTHGDMAATLFEAIKIMAGWSPEDGSEMPLHLLEAMGILLPQWGTYPRPGSDPAYRQSSFRPSQAPIRRRLRRPGVVSAVCR